MVVSMEVDVVGIATAMVLSLSAGMVILWRNNQESLNDRILHTEEQLQNCEEQHKEAVDAIVVLSERVGNLEGFAQRKHGDFLRQSEPVNIK